MAGAGPRRITTTEAAQRLGVKRATLYAYVSRGVLHSERRSGQQESLFDRAEIDALASTTRSAASPQPVLRFRSVATLVSSQVDGDLHYRRIPLTEVVRDHDFASAARLVLGVSPGDVAGPNRTADRAGTRAGAAHDVGALAAAVGHLPLERRLPVAMQLIAAADPLTVDTSPDHVRRAATTAVEASVAAFQPASVHTDDDRDMPRLLVSGLRGAKSDAADTELARVLLIALLDHGLTASTIAARVAASTRAGLHDCLCAAYAVMSGPLHGAAPIAARALIDDPRPAPEAVAAAIRAHGHIPGFGHFLYPDGDPRADIVLEAVWARRGTTRLRRRVEELSRVVVGHSGALPNIDLASAAALHALRLPAAAGEVVVQVARSYGITAHVLEEYAEQPLRWRGREAVG